jgi:hypothetical protein
MVSHNPSVKPLRGWMVTRTDEAGRCLYEAHSVIEGDGVLYEITLREDVDCERIPFLQHLGTEEEFSAPRNNVESALPRGWANLNRQRDS